MLDSVHLEERARRPGSAVRFTAPEDVAADPAPPREDEPAAARGFGVLAAALAFGVVLADEDVERALERDELGAGDFGADLSLVRFERALPGFERDEVIALGLDTGFEVNADGT